MRFLRTPTVPRKTVIGAHLAALVLTAVVMWLLHTAEHDGLLVVSIGVGLYAAVLGGILSVATRRAHAREQRQRENFSAYLAERDHHGAGHGGGS